MAERATGSQNNCSSLGQFDLGAAFKHCLTLCGGGFMVMGGEGKTISALGLGLNHQFLGCDKHG
jgi:hypothetical protein